MWDRVLIYDAEWAEKSIFIPGNPHIGKIPKNSSECWKHSEGAGF